jgi:hypothetical protein
MPRANAKPTRLRASVRVGKTDYPEQLTGGGARTPPVFALELIRRALRHAELSISLQPRSPFSDDVLREIDQARAAIRLLEQAADRVVAQRLSAADTDQVVRELLDALGAPR